MRRAWLVLLALGLPASAWAQAMPTNPDFCASPTITASTGNFTALGAVTDSIIVIPNGVTVTYNQNSTTRYDAICVRSGGLLTFGTTGTLRLRINTLQVDEGGELRVGTVANPFTGTATIEFDGALKAANTSDVDPGQWGMGLLGFGIIRMHGIARTRFVRMTEAPAASATSAGLASIPTGWLSGDALVIPDSKQRMATGGASDSDAPYYAQAVSVAYFDRMTLSSNVTTASATWSTGLTYAHPGGKDSSGTVVMFPHIGNLSSNITVTSVTPAGTRGHTLYGHRADVDIRYVLYKDMGRTTIQDLDCSLRTTGAIAHITDCTEGTGAWTVVGTNQKGRYAVHFHELMGPVNASNTGYQFTFIGNAVVDSTKWGLTVHNSSYGLVQGNIVAFGQGPLYMQEDGNEHFNVIDGNAFFEATSTKLPRGQDGDSSEIGSGGREGAGLWVDCGADNYIRNNVAAGMHTNPDVGVGTEIVSEPGFKIHCNAGVKMVKRPNFRGADLTNASEYTSVDGRSYPLLQFENNEAYGVSSGMTVWHTGSSGYAEHFAVRSVVQSLTVWNMWSEGFYTYPFGYFVFDNFRVYSDPARRGTSASETPLAFTTGDYKALDFEIRNSAFHNVYTALHLQSSDGTFTWRNSTFKGCLGVDVVGFSTPGTVAAPVNWGSGLFVGADPGQAFRTTTVDNVVMTLDDCGIDEKTIRRIYDSPRDLGDDRYSVELPDLMHVVRYQGGTSSFDVFYADQITSDVAGGVSPCSDQTTYPEITGVTCNIVAETVWPVGQPVADFRFGKLRSKVLGNQGGFIPAMTLFDATADWVLPGDGTLSINPASTFTWIYPWSATNGTFLRTKSPFPNTFDSGTIGIRVKLGDQISNMGIGGDGALLEFRPYGFNQDAWAPLEIQIWHPDDPNLAVWFQFGAFLEPRGPYLAPEHFISAPFDFDPATTEFNIVVTWSPTTFKIYVNDGAAQTHTRVYSNANYDTSTWGGWELWVATAPDHIHGVDKQFFDGPIRRLVMYDTVLNDSEVAALGAALEGIPPTISANHRGGQTFITFSESATATTYYVYRETSQITSTSGLTPYCTLTADSGRWLYNDAAYYNLTAGFIVEDLGAPLASDIGLCVVTTATTGSYYYAVTSNESSAIVLGANSLTSAVIETHQTYTGAVQLQACHSFGGAYLVCPYFAWSDYALWEHSHWPSYGYRFNVIKPNSITGGVTYPLTAMLHACCATTFAEPAEYITWYDTSGAGGGTGYFVTLVDQAFTSVNDPYTAATHFHENWYGPRRTSTLVTDLLEKRVTNTLRWAAAQAVFQIDSTRIYAEGASMGSAAMHMVMHDPSLFAAASSAVGLPEACDSGADFSEFCSSDTEGHGTWAHWESLEYKAATLTTLNLPPQVLTWSSDDTLATTTHWPAAIAAMETGKWGYLSLWGTGDHGTQRYVCFTSGSPALCSANALGSQYIYRFKKNEAYPAFTSASNNTTITGSTSGQHNMSLDWSSSLHSLGASTDIVDTSTSFVVSLKATDSNRTATVTIRNTQVFIVAPGAPVAWTNKAGLTGSGATLGSGTAIADAQGLVTITGLDITSAGNQLTLGSEEGAEEPSLSAFGRSRFRDRIR